MSKEQHWRPFLMQKMFFAVISTGFSESLAWSTAAGRFPVSSGALSPTGFSEEIIFLFVFIPRPFFSCFLNGHVKYITSTWEHSIRDVRWISYALSEQPHWPVSQNIHNIFCAEKICPSQHDETSWHSWHGVFTCSSPQPPASSCQQQGI